MAMVILSASVKRFSVSRMRDFFTGICVYKGKVQQKIEQKLLVTTYYLPPTTYQLPPTTHRLSLTTYYLPLTTYHLTLATYHLNNISFIIKKNSSFVMQAMAQTHIQTGQPIGQESLSLSKDKMIYTT